MHRAFFSVAGEDVAKASALAAEFAANQIYLYNKTGQDGADMWQEEAKELRASTVFVIFWSASYLKKKGTLREIRLAVELLDFRRLGHPLIVRLDETPLDSVGDRPGDESHGVEILAPLMQRWRALPLPYDQELTGLNLERLLIDNGTLIPPELNRSTVLQTLTQIGQTTPREVKPVFWISGYEGYGRRFLIEKFMKQYDPNSKRIEIALLDSDGPLQALFRLKGRSTASTETDLAAVVLSGKGGLGGTAEIGELVKTVEDIALKGGHIVITFEALSQDTSRWIPNWLLEWLEAVPLGRKPKLFLVAQFGFPPGLLRRSSLARCVAPYQIQALDFDEARNYVYKLTSFFDQNPERWQLEDIESVADDAGGNISLLIAMARNRSLAPDLKSYAGHESDVGTAFVTKLNHYLDRCVEQIRPVTDAMSILRTLIDLQLVGFSDLKLMFPNADIHTVLGLLIQLGLTESPAEALYRVPRLVVRRLDAHIQLRHAQSSDHFSKQQRFELLFKSQPALVSREPVVDKIETRVRAHLLSGEPIANSPVAKFITVSYLLQAGIRAYHRPDYAGALRLLGECVRARSQFTELNTRCVMLRYFGLAAAREGNTGEMQRAIELLNKESDSGSWKTSRVNPKADAEFVLGMSCRLDERWGDATKHFARSLRGLQDSGHIRVGDCHRELAQCHLKPHHQIGKPDIPPDYSAARFHARQAYESRDTIMALDILVEVLIDSCWKDPKLSDVEKSKLEAELEIYLDRLQSDSTNLGWGTWHQRKAEDLIQYGDADSLEQALTYAREAYAISSREDFQPLIWKILIQLGADTHLVELV